MSEFNFHGTYIDLEINSEEPTNDEMVVRFDDIVIPCDSYYWFVSQERIQPPRLRDRVQELTCDGNSELAFVIMLNSMVEQWVTLSRNLPANLMIAFFDEECHIVRICEADKVKCNILYFVTFEFKGYSDHPLMLQESLGKNLDIELSVIETNLEGIQYRQLTEDLRKLKEHLDSRISELEG